jgi:hypothetical protein
MNLFRALVLMVGTLLCACSGPKPVLYPNAHLQSVGNETAEQDIEACKEAAETPVRMKAVARPDVSRQVRGLAPALVQPVERSEARSPERPVKDP